MVRVLAYLWALPNTLVGALVALLCLPSGTRMQLHTGVLEVHGGLVAWLLRRLPGFSGALALSLGHVVLARSAQDQEECRVHEREHVRQYEIWGPFFLPAYALASLAALLRGQSPYRDNLFERQAYQRERQHLHPGR